MHGVESDHRPVIISITNSRQKSTAHKEKRWYNQLEQGTRIQHEERIGRRDNERLGMCRFLMAQNLSHYGQIRVIH